MINVNRLLCVLGIIAVSSLSRLAQAGDGPAIVEWAGADGHFPEEASVTMRSVEANQVETVRFGSDLYNVAENAGVAQVALYRSWPSYGMATVQYATSNGTATAGVDYVATTGTFWDPGDGTVKYIAVPIINDSVWRGNRSFTLNLSSPSGMALGAPASATVTIFDDEPAPPGTLHFVSEAYGVVESNRTVRVFVGRTLDSYGPVSVQ